MNTGQAIQTILACEAVAKELRRRLAAEARDTLAAAGTVTTHRLPGIAAATAVSAASLAITDSAAFRDWVAARHPSEVYEVHETRVREAFQRGLLADALKRGDPPCTSDGELIPGLEYRPGGEFRSVSIKPSRATAERLALVAAEYASGARPLPQLLPEEGES